MPTPIDAARPSEAPEKDPLRSIAAQLSSPAVNMGMLAALRRFNPVSDGQHNVFEVQQVLLGAGIDLSPSSPAQPRWALVVHCLAIVRGAHDKRVDTGARLADLGFKEARVRQLIDADAALLVDLLPALARRVVAAGVTLNWWPLVHLVVSLDGAESTRSQDARREIAQGFIRATAAKDRA